MTIFDFVGMVGVALCLICYALNILQRMTADGWLYPAANALSSGFILVSLVGNFNLASVLMEGSWLAVSLFGVMTALQRRRLPQPS